jgi:hypothetical protein
MFALRASRWSNPTPQCIVASESCPRTALVRLTCRYSVGEIRGCAGQWVPVPPILVKPCINKRPIVAAVCGGLWCLRHVFSPTQLDRPLRHCVARARSVCGGRAAARGHSDPGVPMGLSASSMVRRPRAPWPGHGRGTCSEPYGHRLQVARGTAVHAGRQPADDRVAFTPAKRSVVCGPIAPRGFDRYFSL